MSTTPPTTPKPRRPFRFNLRALLVLMLAAGIGAGWLLALGLTILFVFGWVVHHRSLPDSAINLVGLTLVLGASLIFWRTMRSLARCRFRFSLRASLAAMTVLGLALGIVGNRLNSVARTHWALWRQGGSVDYTLVAGRDSAWFIWLIQHLGFDPFGKIVEVNARGDGAVELIATHTVEFVDLENVIFGPGVTDGGLEHVAALGQLRNLQCVNFESSPITDVGLRRLAGCRNIRWLMLNSCPQITDAGLAHLAGLPNLEGLYLWEESTKMSLTDAGLTHLRSLTRLERLMIRGTKITDAGLQHIADLNIRFLVLTRTNITDAGAEQLERMTQLETLCFRGTGIGDTTLGRLQKLPKLKSLVLDATAVTDVGVAEFQRALPNVEITR